MSLQSAGSARRPADVPPTARPVPTTRPFATDVDAVRFLALAMLIGFAMFAQLDAISNRLSAGLPITLLSVFVGGVPAATMLLLLAPSPPRAGATGTAGARLILLLMLWAGFSWTLSEHRAEGLSYLIKLSTAVIPALCLLVIVDRAEQMRALIWAMILAGLVASAVVLIESRSGTRIFSTALAATTAGFEGVARSAGASDQNPTTAAQMLMTSAALALGLLFSGEKRGRVVLLAAIALGVGALALMSARSAILGFAGGAAIVLLSLRRHRAFPLILVASAIVGAVGLMFAPPVLWERFAAVGDFGKDQTLFRRVSYLRIGADLVGKSPVWGVGPGNFPLHYLNFDYRFMPGREVFPRELHNTYLDTMAEYGIVGFAIFATLLVHVGLAVRRGMRGDDAIARASFAIGVAFVALLIACFFMPHKDFRYLWLILAMGIQCGRLRRGAAA